MNNATFSQFINHSCNEGKFLAGFLFACRFQIADRITGSFSVKLVSLPAFCCLAYVFFVAL